MIKLLIPILLVSIVFADNLVNLKVNSDEGRYPFVDVEAFTFGNGAYTIMWQSSVASFGGPSPKTILWAQGKNAQSDAEDDGLIVIQLVDSRTMRVCFGGWGVPRIQTIDLVSPLSINTLYSFTVVVQNSGTAGQINFAVYVNTEENPRFVGNIAGKLVQATRTATLGARNELDTNAKSEFMNGLLDNFVIVNNVVTPANRKSLHSPHTNWSPATEILNNIALWIHFDDAILALENTAVAITNVVNGQSAWVSAVVHGNGIFLSHGNNAGEDWRNCRSTGDPHYYNWANQHVNGGEKLLGHYVFQTCDDEDFEIRTHTRMVQWWANTVFRIASIKFRDFVWRMNLDEINHRTHPNYANVATGVPRGRYMKRVTASTWQPLGDSTFIHEETGARYQGWGGNRMRISVPDVAEFEVRDHGEHMALYIKMNLDRCQTRRGTCESQLYIGGNVFFDDLIAPPSLPDNPIPEDNPCTLLELDNPVFLARMEASCLRYYPSGPGGEFYDDCLFDACASGDPDSIPDQDMTPECQLERLTGVDNPNCDLNTCQGACFGRGDCDTATGTCNNCDAGYGGFDCYQKDDFTCHTATFAGLDINVEPRTVFDIQPDNLRKSFTQYSVWSSLLVFPTTYQGGEYLQFVANSPDSDHAGSFTVCIELASGTASNNIVAETIDRPFEVQTNGKVIVTQTSFDVTNGGLCVDVEFPAYTVGGFYIPITATVASFTISVPASEGLTQVLVGSQNNKGGMDVSKVPKSQITTGFTWDMQQCTNSLCSVHDTDCTACYSTAGCGFCQETQRCMSGTISGPRRGFCENWRISFDPLVSRVVTTKYNGADLVDPDYEVYLSQVDSGVPVSIYVPTARTNNNIDVQFMFSTKGTYAVNAEALKNNLLTTLFGIQSDLNLGLGYYGDLRSVVNLDPTRVVAQNQYLFARALEAPTGTAGSSQGGQFAALQRVIADATYRQFARRLAVFTVYDVDSLDGLAAARAAVLKSDVFPVWIIPTGVSQSVVDFWNDLNNRADGIPSLVVRMDQSGSNFQAAFRQLFLLSASYPHVIINDLNDPQFNHVDLVNLEGDTLNIAGLTNTGFRARFNIPMTHNGADITHHIARINIPGFGHSLIEDIEGVEPIITGNRTFSDKENSACIKVTLAAETFNNLASPVFAITKLPTVGKLYEYDPSSLNAVGAEVTLGLYIKKTFCFVPLAHDHSTPGSAVYDSFTYSATDGCVESNEALVSIYVTPLYLAPSAEDQYLSIKETDQSIGFHDLTVTAFEADKTDAGVQEQVSFTWSKFSVEYMSNLHGAQPSNLFDTVADLQDLVADVPYGPFTVDGSFNVGQSVRFVSPGEHFFGTFTAEVTLSDNGNRNVGEGGPYKVVVEVTPVNDAPVATVVGDDVFDNTHVHQWVMEDNTTAIYIIGNDIDNFEVGVDLRLSYVKPDNTEFPTVNGVALSDQWLLDACKSDKTTGFVSCEIMYTPAAQYFTCGDGSPFAAIADIATMGCNVNTPAFTIEYRINDHNNDGFRWPDVSDVVADAVSPVGSLAVHVIAINDAPNPPPNTFVELVEDQAVEDVTIRVTDIDSAKLQIDLFLSQLCPQLVTLTQTDGSPINENDEILDYNVKREFQDHRFRVTTIANLHGASRDNQWEICRVTSIAGDQALSSLTNGFVSIRVRPENDAPFNLLSGFVKAEDYYGQKFNVMDLTAQDIDNNLSDLTYVITQLPWYDLDAGEGVVIHPIDVDSGLVDDDRYLLESDLPYTVPLNTASQALVWVRNLANWYGSLNETETALKYEVTDIDHFLNVGETGYKVNTVPSQVSITIPPVNDRPIVTVQPPSGFEDTVQKIYLLGENDKFGEGADQLDVIIQAINEIYSDSYNGSPQLFYHYDGAWYNNSVLTGEVDVSLLTPLYVDETVTDPRYRVLFVPPQNMNIAASKTESPLFITPNIQYQMTEIISHAEPTFLKSTISDWLSITVTPVNDVPVTWGGDWNIDPIYDEFYGGNEWQNPENYTDGSVTFDNAVCFDDCYFTEDFGSEEFSYLSINPREIKFGGRDVEGDDLQVVIRSADCQAPGLTESRDATFELITDAGRTPVAVEELAGMTLGPLVKRYINGEGYKLVSMLTFAPAMHDWNVEADNEGDHENDESGQVSSYYCQLTYAVVDSEGLASDDADLGTDPKVITIQVRQRNDQPMDSSNGLPSTVIGYEDRDLLLKFDAKDIENDDFYFEIANCDNSRGTFYFPSTEQHEHIVDGVLNLDAGLEVLFSAEVDCDQNDITSPDVLAYSATSGKGWFVLFQPNTDDYGKDFAHIQVSYNDNALTGQAKKDSDRYIEIRAVNDAPVISAREGTQGPQENNVVSMFSPFVIGSVIQFADFDATNIDSEQEFDNLAFQVRVSFADPVNAEPSQGSSAFDVFNYTVTNERGEIRNPAIVAPTSITETGLVRFFGTISQANAYIGRVQITFNRLGNYIVEVVVADAGAVGYCTPDVVADNETYAAGDIRTLTGREGALLGTAGFEDSRCNRVVVATYAVQVSTPNSTYAGITAGVGAGILALLVLAAVAVAKAKKPEDGNGWEALDMAQMANTQKSGIHETAGTSGVSDLYQGKDE